MIPGRRTLVRLRAPLVAKGSQAEVRDWANAVSTPIAGCNGPQPLSTDEFIADREYASSHKRVYAPYGTDILATDRIQDPSDGTVYDVDGNAQPWRDIDGGGHHTAFDVVIREG